MLNKQGMGVIITGTVGEAALPLADITEAGAQLCLQLSSSGRTWAMPTWSSCGQQASSHTHCSQAESAQDMQAPTLPPSKWLSRLHGPQAMWKMTFFKSPKYTIPDLNKHDEKPSEE